MKLQDRIRKGYLFLDGAMGTQLQAAGLKLGERPELLCFTDPETVAAIFFGLCFNSSSCSSIDNITSERKNFR